MDTVTTNISIRQYFIKQLSTTASTCIVANDTIKHTELDWTTIDMTQFDKVEAAAKAKITPTLCCPDILSVSLKIFPPCSNPTCNKKLVIIVGEKIITCGSCNRRLLV